MPTRDSIRDTVIEALGTRALPVDELAREIHERGVVGGGISAAREKVTELLQHDTTFTSLRDGFAHVPTLMDGTVWTAHVDAGDAAEGFVRADPQLSPLVWWLVHGGVDLVDVDGQVLGPLETDSIVIDDGDIDALFGPAGWLDGMSGGWARAEIVGEAMRWSPLSEPPTPDPRQAAALRAGYHKAARDHEALLFGFDATTLTYAMRDAPFHEALLLDREAFVGVPIAPLADMYAAAGLDLREGTVAEPGFDWDAFDARRHRNRLSLVYDLDDEQVDRLTLVAGACLRFVDEGDIGLGATEDEREGAAVLLASLLEDGRVARAFYGECGQRDVTVADLQRFVDALVALLGGTLPAGLGWLRAECLDLEGDAVAADELLRSLVTSSCEHEPLLVKAAELAADRGDAVSAYRWLRQAGVLDHERSDDELDLFGPSEAERLADEVAGFALHRPRALAGRNDPCPCGSGRKYKTCHLGREQHPLADRSAWLFEKAARFARVHAREWLDELADLLTEHQPRLRRSIADSGFLADLALHEGGVFGEFLAARSALLPDDESLLATQWSLVDRSVFEVRRIAGDRLELRDIATGDDITVVNVTPGDSTRPGTVFVGRPLPVGDDYRAFSGFVPLPPAAVHDMLAAIDAGDPDEIAMIIADTLRPPRVTNTDGDQLVLHTITWRVADPAAVGPALVTAGLLDAGENRWHVSRDTTILASLRLEGDLLVGEANSEPRASDLMERVREAVPDAVLLDSDVRSMDEMIAGFDPDEHPAAPAPPDDPALQAAMAGFMVEQERRWIDEHIPALGGRTPRAAAQDPIGREELLQLLASFPEVAPDDFGAMSPGRLRQLLDL